MTSLVFSKESRINYLNYQYDKLVLFLILIDVMLTYSR